MNKTQQACVKALERVFERCHKAGLRGGCYGDGFTFCVWPEKVAHPADQPRQQFFDYVREVGHVIHTRMTLDGGAGT